MARKSAKPNNLFLNYQQLFVRYIYFCCLFLYLNWNKYTCFTMLRQWLKDRAFAHSRVNHPESLIILKQFQLSQLNHSICAGTKIGIFNVFQSLWLGQQLNIAVPELKTWKPKFWKTLEKQQLCNKLIVGNWICTEHVTCGNLRLWFLPILISFFLDRMKKHRNLIFFLFKHRYCVCTVVCSLYFL